MFVFAYTQIIRFNSGILTSHARCVYNNQCFTGAIGEMDRIRLVVVENRIVLYATGMGRAVRCGVLRHSPVSQGRTQKMPAHLWKGCKLTRFIKT